MKLFLAQINPTIGAFDETVRLIIQALDQAKKEGADLVLFPELVLTGYPPEDFLLVPEFLDRVDAALKLIVPATKGTAALVGLPRRERGRLYNSAACIIDGKLCGFADKQLLPTYDVFDEKRYFTAGIEPFLFDLKGKKIAVTICEDIWQCARLEGDPDYPVDPIEDLVPHAPDWVVNLSASPFYVGKFDRRLAIGKKVVQRLGCSFALVNQVGGNDSLIFDGRSFALNPEGELTCLLPSFAPAIQQVEEVISLPQFPPEIERMEALARGLYDFCHKLKVPQVVIGLSGGIDSAVVASLAALTLGKESVTALMMPSRFTSQASLEDARLIAQSLGIAYAELSIEPMLEAYLKTLEPNLGVPLGLVAENLQARIRGAILMAYANKIPALLLNTGNKSELALGYCTLYGDMCGALAVIGDLTKEEVYQLGRTLNALHPAIPERVFDRAPSAELAPDQKDSDSLPPYPIVDALVEGFVERNLRSNEIDLITDVEYSETKALLNRLLKNEFKRRQAPPILKVTPKTFVSGRRFPIVEGFRF